MPPAARVGDTAMHSGPHCHAPIHPPAPTPTPMPHPPMPITIMPPGCPTVLIGSMPAARATDQTMPCMMPCIPGGPGIIMMGSATVMIGNMPAARLNDPVQFAACVGPVPGPMGTIMGGPCAPTVMIGG